MPDPPPGHKHCSCCHRLVHISGFNLRTRNSVHGKKGELTAECRDCIERRARKRKAPVNDNDDTPADNEPISLEEFISLIADASDGCMDVEAHVDMGESASELEDAGRADKLREIIGEHTKLRWRCVHND